MKYAAIAFSSEDLTKNLISWFTYERALSKALGFPNNKGTKRYDSLPERDQNEKVYLLLTNKTIENKAKSLDIDAPLKGRFTSIDDEELSQIDIKVKWEQFSKAFKATPTFRNLYKLAKTDPTVNLSMTLVINAMDVSRNEEDLEFGLLELIDSSKEVGTKSKEVIQELLYMYNLYNVIL